MSPRADRPSPPAELSSPAEQPNELAPLPTVDEVRGERQAPPDIPPAPFPPLVGRVSPGKTLHTARGLLEAQQTVWPRDVGGDDAFRALVDSGAIYTRP